MVFSCCDSLSPANPPVVGGVRSRFLARVNSQAGHLQSLPGVQRAATGRCTVSVTAPVSSEQKSARQSCRQPLLGDVGFFRRSWVACFCCFFVAVGTTCLVLRYAHAHTDTHHGHWPVWVQVCSVLLCTHRVTLKNTGTT